MHTERKPLAHKLLATKSLIRPPLLPRVKQTTSKLIFGITALTSLLAFASKSQGQISYGHPNIIHTEIIQTETLPAYSPSISSHNIPNSQPIPLHQPLHQSATLDHSNYNQVLGISHSQSFVAPNLLSHSNFVYNPPVTEHHDSNSQHINNDRHSYSPSLNQYGVIKPDLEFNQNTPPSNDIISSSPPVTEYHSSDIQPVPNNLGVRPSKIENLIDPKPPIEPSELTDEISTKPNPTPRYSLSNSTPPKSSAKEVPVGFGSKLWKWTTKQAHHKSIVKVETQSGSGTGVIVSINYDKEIKGKDGNIGYEGYILTARHVVEDDLESCSINVKYQKAQKDEDLRGAQRCSVIAHDEDNDVALIWAWVPKDIPPAKIADKPIQREDKIELAGLGGGSKLHCCIRHFDDTASCTTNLDKIFADAPLLPGDSGGPIFNEHHEVVGTISGGWFWWESEVQDPSGNAVRTTWPTRGANLVPIKAIINEVKEKHKNRFDQDAEK